MQRKKEQERNRAVGNAHNLRTGRGAESGWKSGPGQSEKVKNCKNTSSLWPRTEEDV